VARSRRSAIKPPVILDSLEVERSSKLIERQGDQGLITPNFVGWAL